MSWKAETPARPIASTMASATMYQATFNRTTRNDEMDAFLIASLYDKYISKYNNNLSIYDYYIRVRMYNGFMKRQSLSQRPKEAFGRS